MATNKYNNFGTVDQSWVTKEFVATWYETDNERHVEQGFVSRAAANKFLKAKGITVHPRKTYIKMSQFRK